MNWQVGINCTKIGGQNITTLNFGVSTVNGTSTPNCNRFTFFCNPTTTIFRNSSPCYITSGSEVLNIAPAKNVFLNLSIGFSSTPSGLSLNTTESYFRAIRIA